MPIDLDQIWVFRIVPIQNLELLLRQGLHSKNAGRQDNGFVTIGSKEIITERDTREVRCYPETVVNDYVPFYFSVRTPMLYNIVTGHGVPSRPQQDIIYLCFKLNEFVASGFQWCFTDGNAAKRISKFFNNINQLEDLDWHSINTTDFRDENADGDEDRIRKKHAEFLVKDYVPVHFIRGIGVLNQSIREIVQNIVNMQGLNIPVQITKSYYFL